MPGEDGRQEILIKELNDARRTFVCFDRRPTDTVNLFSISFAVILLPPVAPRSEV